VLEEPDILKEEAGKVALGFQRLSETNSKARRQKQPKKKNQNENSALIILK
jgi:hypothetical protein